VPDAVKETRYLDPVDGVEIPVATVRGAQDGPTLVVVAGVHGSEYDGIEAVKRLFSWVDEHALAGTLVTVPCLNVPAFYGLAAHVNPIDGVNPWDAWPGSANGSHTARMLDLVWRELVQGADAVIDVHGGDLEEELAEYSQIDLTGDARVDAAGEELARALDLPIFVRTPEPDSPATNGSLFGFAAVSGIPGVLVEAGSHGQLDERTVGIHFRALRNALHHLGMLPGEPTRDHPRPLEGARFLGVQAPMDGCWYPSVRTGDILEAGQTVGEMRDLFDETRAVVSTEEGGVVLGVMTVLPRRKDEWVLGLATIE
jgi:uncharacterized protein